MSEKTYELKDKEAGFYDDESGLDISRDAKVKIDTNKGAGTKTMQMIATGGLVEVGRKSKSSGYKGGNGDEDPDALPADFPGRDALIEGGFSTRSAVDGASDEDLTALKGVGEKTVEHIREYK